MREKLGLESLHLVEGGAICRTFDFHLVQAINDCSQRCGDDKPRVILLKCEVAPAMDQDGSADNANVTFSVKGMLPPHVARPINCKVTKGKERDAQLLFNVDAPDDYDQGTLDELSERYRQGKVDRETGEITDAR